MSRFLAKDSPVVGRSVGFVRERAEQQAFAEHDPNDVMGRYLPAQLEHPEKFLP